MFSPSRYTRQYLMVGAVFAVSVVCTLRAMAWESLGYMADMLPYAMLAGQVGCELGGLTERTPGTSGAVTRLSPVACRLSPVLYIHTYLPT